MDTNRYDNLCIICRFAQIDRAASDLVGIRADMRATGVPLNGAGTSDDGLDDDDSAGR